MLFAALPKTLHLAKGKDRPLGQSGNSYEIEKQTVLKAILQ